MSQSTSKRLWLSKVTQSTGGLFRCEVSGEGPAFETDAKDARFIVVGIAFIFLSFYFFFCLFLSFSVFVVCEEGMFMACAMNRLKEIFRELGVILPEPASHLPPFFFVVVVVFHPSFSFFLWMKRQSGTIPGIQSVSNQGNQVECRRWNGHWNNQTACMSFLFNELIKWKASW